jgi:hypothetical protein
LLRRIGLATALAVAVLIALVSCDALWGPLPNSVRAIQFPFRLDPWTTLVIAGLATIGLIAASQHRRAWITSAWVVVLIAMALGQWQAWTAISEGWQGQPQTVVANKPPYPFTFPGQEIGFRLLYWPSTLVQPGRGDEVTDTIWSPLIEAHGATILGHNADGYAVISRPTSRPVTFSEHDPDTVRAAKWLSLLMIVAGSCLVLLSRRRSTLKRPAASPTMVRPASGALIET